MSARRIGVVGARGFVGGELLPLLFARGDLEVAWVTSSSAAGEAVPGAHLQGPRGTGPLTFRAADPRLLRDEPVDGVFLALPNGESEPWARAAGDAVVVDLSSDHRFDEAWVYGQPERFRARIRTSKRIASPGCYATAAQLAVAPLSELVTGAVHVFGISGYSGAGTAKSERNDPETLRDNVLPYALVGHAHERELRRYLAHPIYFMPHVAPFFRGLVVTVSTELVRSVTEAELAERYTSVYAGEPFVEMVREAPRPRDLVGKHGVRVGGLAVGDEGRHAVVVAALDNLLGGAASQAMRAMNLALGLDERAGCEVSP